MGSYSWPLNILKSHSIMIIQGEANQNLWEYGKNANMLCLKKNIEYYNVFNLFCLYNILFKIWKTCKQTINFYFNQQGKHLKNLNNTVGETNVWSCPSSRHYTILCCFRKLISIHSFHFSTSTYLQPIFVPFSPPNSLK